MKIIPVVLLMGVIALVAGSMAIVNSEFGDTMDQCWNSSFSINTAGDACINNTLLNVSEPLGKDGLNVTDQYYTVIQGQDAIENISSQQNTVAIIIVMVIIILALVSIFGFIGLRRM